ncbi:MAG: hypothetical protein M3N53_02170 [Actinomycetota bacterium]|nr:hypothetical protein [Actinomycetota bacterium]
MDRSRRTFIRGTLAAVGAAATRFAPAQALARRRRKNEPLFADEFKRRNRDGWGGVWFNQRYGRSWRVESGRGIYRMPETENRNPYRPNPVLVLDRDVADIDVRTTLSTTNATARIGVAARATGYADYYVAYLSPDNLLRIGRCGHHDLRKIGTKQMRYVANRRYRIRFQVRGSGPVRLRAKAWPAGSAEPLKWTLEVIDSAPDAIRTKGAFGVCFQHATDRRSAAARVVDFVARSDERGSTTPPALTFSFVGPPSGSSATAVAKTAVPAEIRFEVARDPAFTQLVQTTTTKRTNRALAVKGRLDFSSFGESSVVYWRAVATRKGATVVGPTSSFRTGPAAGLPVRFTFGSCTRWDPTPKKSFEHARLKFPDFYLHQGDFGYVFSKVVAQAPDTYHDHWTRMLLDPALAGLTREVPLGLARDDAEYGNNRADSHTMRRFTVRTHDDMNGNPGPYYETRYGDVAVFSIDCRGFSTGRGVPLETRSKLGDAQKQWLKESMVGAVSEGMALLAVSSPMAFGSDASPESWRRQYTFEWSELMDFFQTLGAPVLILSGDAHGHRLHEFPQKNLSPDVPRIVEMVSSGTEQNKFFDDIDPRFLIKKAKGSGFGLVELGAEQDVGGQRTRTLTLTAVKTSDGSPYWTASYLVVRGVGLLPIAGG